MLKSYGYTTPVSKRTVNKFAGFETWIQERIGKGTWTFLHILAATYPVNPSPEVIQDHKLFFQLLPRIYPCPDCRVHMRQMFHELPRDSKVVPLSFIGCVKLTIASMFAWINPFWLLQTRWPLGLRLQHCSWSNLRRRRCCWCRAKRISRKAVL